MFSKGKLNKEVTPQRVYALLKLVEYTNKKCTKEEIYKYIQPEHLSEKQAEVKKVFKFCLDEEFLMEDFDKKVCLTIDRLNIESNYSFRRYINSILYDDIKDNKFYSISKAMLSKELELYDVKGFENIGAILNTTDSQEDLILGWRFWAAFLGYGFVLNSQFVLNPYERLRDLINIKFGGMKNKIIPLREFIGELVLISPEVVDSINGNQILLPLALALTTLNDLGVISLSNVRDSEDVWQFNLGDSIQMVTHINLLGGEIIG